MPDRHYFLQEVELNPCQLISSVTEAMRGISVLKVNQSTGMSFVQNEKTETQSKSN